LDLEFNMGLLDNIRELDSGSRFASARPMASATPVNNSLAGLPFNNPPAPQGMSADDKSALALGLASGFAGMSGNPNSASIMAGIQSQQEALAANREKTSLNQQTVEQRNRTATMLINMGGDFAKIGTALLRGQIDTDQAMSMHDTIAGKTTDKTFTMMSESDRIAAGLPIGSYQTDSLGRTYSIGKDGTKVIVNTGDNKPNVAEQLKKLAGKEGEIWATYLDAGSKAATTFADINSIGQLLELSPTGPAAGRFVQMFGGISTNADAVKAIIARLAPSMRVAGSGSTSDIEVKMMQDSLGSLLYSPEANRLIHTAFKAKLAIDLQRSKIVNAVSNEDITVKDARRQLQALNEQSILSQPLVALLQGQSASATPPPSGTGNIAAGNAAIQSQMQTLMQRKSQLMNLNQSPVTGPK
jgi:hypothetical protein